MKQRELEKEPSKRRANQSSELRQRILSSDRERLQVDQNQEELQFAPRAIRHGIQLEIDHALKREGLLTKIEKGRTHAILIAVHNLYFNDQLPIDLIVQRLEQKYDIKSLYNHQSIYYSRYSLLDYAISAKRSQEENSLENLHKYLSNEVMSFKIPNLPGRRCAIELCGLTGKIVGLKIYPIS